MKMYLMTELEHAQIVDALSRVNIVDDDCDILSPSLADATTEAEDMLKAMKPVEPVGWWDTIDGADFTYSINELCGGTTDGLKPLYAKEQQ